MTRDSLIRGGGAVLVYCACVLYFWAVLVGFACVLCMCAVHVCCACVLCVCAVLLCMCAVLVCCACAAVLVPLCRGIRGIIHRAQRVLTRASVQRPAVSGIGMAAAAAVDVAGISISPA